MRGLPVISPREHRCQTHDATGLALKSCVRCVPVWEAPSGELGVASWKSKDEVRPEVQEMKKKNNNQERRWYYKEQLALFRTNKSYKLIYDKYNQRVSNGVISPGFLQRGGNVLNQHHYFSSNQSYHLFVTFLFLFFGRCFLLGC